MHSAWCSASRWSEAPVLEEVRIVETQARLASRSACTGTRTAASSSLAGGTLRIVKESGESRAVVWETGKAPPEVVSLKKRERSLPVTSGTKPRLVARRHLKLRP